MKKYLLKFKKKYLLQLRDVYLFISETHKYIDQKMFDILCLSDKV